MVTMTQLPTMEYAGEIDLDTADLHDPATGELITNALIDRENDEIDRRFWQPVEANVTLIEDGTLGGAFRHVNVEEDDAPRG